MRREGAAALDLNWAHGNFHWVVDGYDDGGGDGRVVEKVVLSTKASQVDDKVHLPHHLCGEGEGVGAEENVMVDILTLVNE